MIAITRLLARQLRNVLRRARIGNSNVDQGKTIALRTTTNGLVVQAASPEVRIEYRQPGSYEPEELAVPIDLLARCEGRRQETVTLERRGAAQVVASWSDRGLPQAVELHAPLPASDIESPETPETLAENTPDLLRALKDAVPITDQASSRYALGCLQLRGAQGKIAATDGRQIFVQRGYQFPWLGDLLVPASKVFGCPELADDLPVMIGATDNWLTLVCGAWTISLRVQKDGRFPRVDDLIRPCTAALSHLSIGEADAEFLERALPRISCDDPVHKPVTLDLNGQVLVRARPEQSGRVTELALTNSRLQGDHVTLNTNREFLVRAAKLGFRDIYLFGPESPALCDDGQRQYLWALLEAKDAIKPAEDALRIESLSQAVTDQTIPTVSNRRRFTVTSSTAEPSVTQATSTPRKSTAPSPAETGNSPIAQATALRVALHDVLSKTGELIRTLKRQKRQSRLLSSTLASLKELQKVAS